MNLTQQAHRAYAPVQAHIHTPRAIEARLLSDITSRLRKGPKNYPSFVSAVQDNRKLWTTLAIEVADRDNVLPQALRAQIFYLAEFTENHTHKILAGTADAQPLVDINTAVVRGLNGQADAE
ncbi:MAG: flagellar biosynthesis regulator FlaF [Loktanella sp.]|nr:flagellar biosynthesis regulator FlaF [Loktanella sp.]